MTHNPNTPQCSAPPQETGEKDSFHASSPPVAPEDSQDDSSIFSPLSLLWGGDGENWRGRKSRSLWDACGPTPWLCRLYRWFKKHFKDVSHFLRIIFEAFLYMLCLEQFKGRVLQLLHLSRNAVYIKFPSVSKATYSCNYILGPQTKSLFNWGTTLDTEIDSTILVKPLWNLRWSRAEVLERLGMHGIFRMMHSSLNDNSPHRMFKILLFIYIYASNLIILVCMVGSTYFNSLWNCHSPEFPDLHQ